jgi:acetyltransferase-like isoleucine patch superfamily enzyme
VTQLVLLEPEDPEGRWHPFGGVRPISELRAGAWRIRERWEQALGVRAAAIMGSTVAGFVDVDCPPVVAPHPVAGPVIIAASDFAPDLGRLVLPSGVTQLVSHGRPVAQVVAAGPGSPTLVGTGPAMEVSGLWLAGTFSLLDALEHFLGGDCDAFSAVEGEPPAGALVLGDAARVRSASAGVEPGVVFDVRDGCVAIMPGAEVRSGTRIEGPCWIGEGARLLGGFVRRSVIGPRAVVRGEVSNSIFTGYCNKAHDGFVGHSVLGHWVNLGALTTTSNLKNTYGSIRLDTPHGPFETGRQFLGSLIGDHARTAIGTMLGTGTIVGAGANVFGDARPPKWIPPFAWGLDGREETSEEGFLTVARRVLPRRNVTVTPAHEAWLASLYRRLT